MSFVIGIVGSGNMGCGLAEVAAQSGFHTLLVKVTPGDLDKPRKTIEAAYGRAVKKERLTVAERDAALARLQVAGSLDALAHADLVIESVIEDLARKREVFAALEKHIRPDAILASNTSSLRLAALVEGMEHVDRFIGMHFFSPVAAMKLVEVAPLATTRDEVTDRVMRFVTELGKTAVLVSDTAGYLVNRMLVPFLLDGLRLLDANLSSAASIDTAMKLGLGHPLGPLALADAIGLDIVLAMADSLYHELGDHRFVAPPSLRRLVHKGHLGKKTGAGIYRYEGTSMEENFARLGPRLV